MLNSKAIYITVFHIYFLYFSIFLEQALESLVNAMSINKIYFVISFSDYRSLIILKQTNSREINN